MSFRHHFATVHPASQILLWLTLTLILQWLPLSMLLWLALLIFPLALGLAGRRFRLLLRRIRWLLLSIAVLFAFATSGTLLPDPAGALGITREGLEFAATHTLRLLQLIALLAMLLERLGIPALVSGFYVLLGGIGLQQQRGRMALRLMLVLEYVEQGRELRRRGQRSGWQDWFDPARSTSGTPAEMTQPAVPIELHIAPLTIRDRLIMLLTLPVLIAAYLWLGSRA
ncbi:MAG: hypothetical protein KUL75_07465 [Sterolibacterium sp.]|nr:hypothetical protein [Sterolibacterium sp.]